MAYKPRTCIKKKKFHPGIFVTGKSKLSISTSQFSEVPHSGVDLDWRKIADTRLQSAGNVHIESSRSKMSEVQNFESSMSLNGRQSLYAMPKPQPNRSNGVVDFTPGQKPYMHLEGDISGLIAAVVIEHGVDDLLISHRNGTMAGEEYGILQLDPILGSQGRNSMVKVSVEEGGRLIGGRSGASFPWGSKSELAIKKGGTVSGNLFGLEERDPSGVAELRALLHADAPAADVVKALEALGELPSSASGQEKADAVEKSGSIKSWLGDNWSTGLEVLGRLVIEAMKT